MTSATFRGFSPVVGLDLTSERLFVKSVLTETNLHKNCANYNAVAYSGVSVETYFGDVIGTSVGATPYCPGRKVYRTTSTTRPSHAIS